MPAERTGPERGINAGARQNDTGFPSGRQGRQQRLGQSGHDREDGDAVNE
jgi:hypothetical protein